MGIIFFVMMSNIRDMARQIGLIKIRGKLDGTVTYNLNGKEVTRKIGVVDKEKMQTAPQYETTRKNQSEFAKASKAGQLFRNGLLPITKGYTNYKYPIAVMQLMLKAIKADKSNPIGQRNIQTGLKEECIRTAFKRLHIFCKRSTRHFGEHFTISGNEDGFYSLKLSSNHKEIKEKYPVIIKFDYLYFDYETMHTQLVTDKLVLPDASTFEPTESRTFPLPDDVIANWVFYHTGSVANLS
jgi:hypothetical protein